jgi:hypothetical protein
MYLPLKFLPGWLFGICTSHVKPELQEKLLRYQRESYNVLWEAFQEGRLTAGTAFEDLLTSDTPAAHAYEMASAIMQIARQQLLSEALRWQLWTSVLKIGRRSDLDQDQ